MTRHQRKLSRLAVGTSGFSYKDWEGNFYPEGLKPGDYLRHYSSHYSTVEIDMTFYRIPSNDMIERWKAATPDDFSFCAKFPQMVTHEGKLEDRISDANRFVDVMRRLDNKLGPLLLQFPYSFKPDQLGFLTRLVEGLPTDVRISLEIRNRNWLKVPEFFALLREKGIGFCLVQHPWVPRSTETTADFVYLRFLGDHKTITEDFSYVRDDKEEDLQWWRETVLQLSRAGREIFIFFNNHYSGHAPTTADRFKELLGLQ